MHAASTAFSSPSGWRRAVVEAGNRQGLITSYFGQEQRSENPHQADRRSAHRRYPPMSVAVHVLDLGRIGLNGGGTGQGQVEATCQVCVEAQDRQANQRSLPRNKAPFSPGELAKPWHGRSPHRIGSDAGERQKDTELPATIHGGGGVLPTGVQLVAFSWVRSNPFDLRNAEGGPR